MQITLKARNREWRFSAECDESLLMAALGAGLQVPYECATGTCGACRVQLHSGRVVDPWPEAVGRGEDPAARLMCQCRPMDDCTIEAKSYIYSTDEIPRVVRRTEGEIIALRVLTPDVIEFTVMPQEPLRYLAGQFVTLSHPDINGQRAYSMTSFDPDGLSLTFLVKRSPGGGWTDWLFARREVLLGERLRIDGPYGRATFSPDLGMNIACIAGGSGIAGMRAILERAVRDEYFQQYRGAAFFGVRTPRDIYWLRELDALSSKGGKKLAITVAYSDEPADNDQNQAFPNLSFAVGLVHEVAAAGLKGRFRNLRAYLAGPPPAVDSSQRMLLVEGKLSPVDIRYDKFN